MRTRHFQSGLSFTALALWGAGAIGVMVFPSCAASPGGAAGGHGGTGGGGTGGGGSGGGGTGGGGAGGGGDGGGGGGGSSDAAEVRFDKGRASGPLTGNAFVTLGIENSVSDPVCDNSEGGGAADDPITKDQPCNGTTKWSRDAALCISGKIPPVTNGNYDADFGLQIVVNSSEPAYANGDGHVLGEHHATIAFHYDQGTITPPLPASQLRVIVHRGGDDAESVYCAIVNGSGEAIALTSFNTACWPGGKGTNLADEDITKIDKVGIQLSSDEKHAFDVQDFCLEKIVFGD